MSGFEELLLSVDGSASQAVVQVGLDSLGLREREHLQEWVIAHPSILGPGVRIITTEFDKWESSEGTQVRDRLDVLGVGPDGRPVVVELKRGSAPATIHMQALNYAAMVSRLGVQDLAELLVEHAVRRGEVRQVEAALAELETQFLVTDDTIRNPRVVLIAGSFPASATATVVWLNERGVDVTLIRFRAYIPVSGQNPLVSFSKLFPVPTVEEFTIGRSGLRPSEVFSDQPEDVPWDAEAILRVTGRVLLSSVDELV